MSIPPSQDSPRHRVGYVVAAGLLAVALHRGWQREYLAAVESLVFAAALAAFLISRGKEQSLYRWLVVALVVAGLALAFVQ